MDERLERVYARWCARSVLHLWDAPEVVRSWVDEGEEELRGTAYDAARAAARATDAAAEAAARAAARAASRAAARVAAADATARVAAAWDAELVAERVAAADVVWAAARAKQSRTLDLLGILPDLITTHGLAARLLDDAREDPWLTREVVRALALPDLAVWVDWHKQMEVWQ